MISACLLPDIDHLLHDLGDDTTLRGIDDRHEYRAIPALRNLLPPAVTEPIRMYVEAKRYLCSVDEAYWQGLSTASKRSLEFQGGIFTSEAAAAFTAKPTPVKVNVCCSSSPSAALPLRHGDASGPMSVSASISWGLLAKTEIA